MKIQDPRIAFFDLSNGKFLHLLSADERALSSLFQVASSVETGVPKCEVLFLYPIVEPRDDISGYPDDLGEVIRSSGAFIIVIATENSGERYVAWAKREPLPGLSIVMTIKRRETAFTDFFSRLFDAMFSGKSMDTAWNMVARSDVGPELVVIAGAPPITFHSALGVKQQVNLFQTIRGLFSKP